MKPFTEGGICFLGTPPSPRSMLASLRCLHRNWICVAAAAQDLELDWISYVPAYRSRAMTGVGLCFAHWA